MLQKWRYFIDVVDEHHFTRAADNNHISQSAISQQIRDLEYEIGVPLLKRVGRSFEVTEAGQYFYRGAKKIIREADRLVQETNELGRKSPQFHASVRVGYLAGFVMKEFLEAAASFSKSHPAVDVKMVSGIHEKLFRLLQKGAVDLCFSDQRRALSSAYHNEFLTETRLVAVVGKGQFPEEETISAEELAGLPCLLVMDEKDRDLTAGEEKYYRDVIGVQGPVRVVRSFDEAQMMTAAGRGYFIQNDRTPLSIDRSVNDIFYLTRGGEPLTQKLYMYWKKDHHCPWAEPLVQAVKDQFQKEK